MLLECLDGASTSIICWCSVFSFLTFLSQNLERVCLCLFPFQHRYVFEDSCVKTVIIGLISGAASLYGPTKSPVSIRGRKAASGGAGGTRNPPTLPLAAPSRGELPSTLADGAGATEGLLLTFKKAPNVAKLFCEQILPAGQSRSDCHPHREWLSFIIDSDSQQRLTS